MTFLENVDRKKLQKIMLIVISALTLAALALLVVIIVSSVGSPAPQNTDIKFKSVEVSKKDLSTGSLLIVNPKTEYDVPTDDVLDLVLASEYRNTNSQGDKVPYYINGLSTTKLNSSAMAAVHNMLVQLTKDTNDDDVMIQTGFRNYEDQANKEIEQGHSDHHTGMLVALTKFEDALSKDQTAWLTSNAHKYGFVARYPEGKDAITGVSDYTYAYRYVGVAHATYMTEHELCLEEYVEYLKKNHGDGKEMLEITLSDGAKYAVYYVECRSGGKINVPEALPYTISGTNEGGVIVTVELSK